MEEHPTTGTEVRTHSQRRRGGKPTTRASSEHPTTRTEGRNQPQERRGGKSTTGKGRANTNHKEEREEPTTGGELVVKPTTARRGKPSHRGEGGQNHVRPARIPETAVWRVLIRRELTCARGPLSQLSAGYGLGVR